MSCLYPRLNEALRNHDIAALEPFLPFMKLLLTGLYQLPLVHTRTYRGVKLELYKVSGDIYFPEIYLASNAPYATHPTPFVIQQCA